MCQANSSQVRGHDVEELKKKLEEVTQENVLLKSELERLKKTLQLDEVMPNSAQQSRWLAWAQQLQDGPTVAQRAKIALQKKAMESDEDCQAIESALAKFKDVFDKHPCASFDEITCWGDVETMFERLNCTKKGDSLPINWSLEIEEGWVPYKTLSSHAKRDEKVVVHACDPFPGIMEGVCSVCQFPFGPEGALSMGQCRHIFHVKCIIKASLD